MKALPLQTLAQANAFRAVGVWGGAGLLKPFQFASRWQWWHALMVFVMASVFAAGAVAQSEAAGSAKALVTVGATVLRHLSVRVLTLPRTIQIAPADIARGYVDMPFASKLEIRSNAPIGYLLTVKSLADFSTGIELRGIDGAASHGRTGMLSARTSGKGMHMTPLELSFRVLLSAQARPGHHPWLIEISVLPV
jgi:hypothetical protein